MSSAVETDPRPIESRAQLVDYFARGEKERDERAVGTEHEKFLFRRDNLQMVSHGGEGGIEEIFEGLIDQFDWSPTLEDGRIIGLHGDDGGITLEPGGQFELSGAVEKTVHGTKEELDRHFDQLQAVTDEQFYMTCWGMNPYYAPLDVPLVPKQRYDIMRSYLPTRGELAPWMMKTSCTIQANYDYTSEADAVDIVRTALLVSPIVSAIFANSPYRAGRDTGMQTFRGYAWTKTDPDRTGWPAFMYREDWGYEDYLEYVLDVPMFFIKRQGRLVPMIGTTFREFLEGKNGRFEPTMNDFVLHLSTAFPEIRLKQFIEVRGADGGPRNHMTALPAIWKGILYHEPSRERAADLLGGIDPEEHADIFMDVYRDGLKARTPEGTVRELAGELLDLAEEGLAALGEEYDHESEVGFLEPLRRIVDSGETLADQLRADIKRYGDDRRSVLEKWSLV